NITTTGSTIPRFAEVEDLKEMTYVLCVEMEIMNMDLFFLFLMRFTICGFLLDGKKCGHRVERFDEGNYTNQVEEKTRFTIEFDQFCAEPGEY
ncbi:hypothetical protein Tco_1076659, partial [Tanacetum coccineum]